jgi:hypothetical protein
LWTSAEVCESPDPEIMKISAGMSFLICSSELMVVVVVVVVAKRFEDHYQ